jgi:hypothetical protein
MAIIRHIPDNSIVGGFLPDQATSIRPETGRMPDDPTEWQQNSPDHNLHHLTDKRSPAGIFARVGNIILLFFIAFHSSLGAMETAENRIDRIKSDPDMVWAEREANEFDEATRLAEKELIRKIQVSITVSSETEKCETGGSLSSVVNEQFIDRHQTFASLYLKGLDHIESRSGKHCTVLAFIHRDSLAQSFELRKHKIRGFVNGGMAEAGKGHPGEALRNLYWGYLLALTYPDTIHLGLTADEGGLNAQVLLYNLLTNYLDQIRVAADDCYMDGQTAVAPLHFVWGETPVDGLNFTYYSGLGMEYALVVNGRTDIPLYDQPVSPSRKLVISIEYEYAPLLNTDPEIAALHEMFAERTFTNYRSIDLHFPWLVKGAVVSEKTPEEKVTDLPPPAISPPFPKEGQRGFSQSTYQDSTPDLETRQRTEAIDVLRDCKETSQFLDLLDQYDKLGILSFGRKNDFQDGKGCYVAVINENRVEELLFYDGSVYRNLKDDSTFTDLAAAFKGKKQLWIKPK